jgi:ABC-type lipoprotein release transport system permease subunit
LQDLEITGRDEIGQMLESAYAHKGGIFHVLWIVGAALAIPAFLVTSGFGMKELAREVGVMKAIGWRHWEVLEKTLLENLLLSLTAASLSLLLSMAWMKGLNGALIAQFYIAEVGILPLADIPSRYLPAHGLFCLVFSLCVTLAGSLFSTWRHCRKPPVVSMR